MKWNVYSGIKRACVLLTNGAVGGGIIIAVPADYIPLTVTGVVSLCVIPLLTENGAVRGKEVLCTRHSLGQSYEHIWISTMERSTITECGRHCNRLFNIEPGYSFIIGIIGWHV